MHIDLLSPDFLWLAAPFLIGGFLDVLKTVGKGLGVAGGVAAAPFTGGASLAPILGGLGGALGAIGSVGGGAAEGAAGGRLAEAGVLNQANRNILDRAGLEQSGILSQAGLQQQGDLSRAGLDLQRRGFQETAPNNRLDQARRADQLLNLNQAIDQSDTRPGFASGRIDPRVVGRVSGDTGSLAELVRSRALSAQQAGDQFDPLSAPEFELPEIPELLGAAGPGGADEAGPGFLEKAGGTTSTIASILAALAQRNQPQRVQGTPDFNPNATQTPGGTFPGSLRF